METDNKNNKKAYKTKFNFPFKSYFSFFLLFTIKFSIVCLAVFLWLNLFLKTILLYAQAILCSQNENNIKYKKKYHPYQHKQIKN